MLSLHWGGCAQDIGGLTQLGGGNQRRLSATEEDKRWTEEKEVGLLMGREARPVESERLF